MAVVRDKYDELIPGLPVPGLIVFPYDKKFDRKAQATLRRARAEMIAEYERNKRAEAETAAEGRETST